jgi:hypothetical protein
VDCILHATQPQCNFGRHRFFACFYLNDETMDKNKNQGQQGQEGRSGQSNTENRNVGRAQGNEPRDNNPSGKDKSSDASQKSSDTSKAGEWPRPLTNQDEQRKSTNVGGGNRGEGEEESEGDERIKPYKNIGDDSEEVEKKTPTME